MQPDFPEPVVPAMRRCGMRARSVQTALPGDVLAEPDRHGARGLRDVAEDVAEGDEVRAQVRDLDAHCLLAGDRRQDADLGGRERVGEVVLQRGDLGHLRAGCELELVARDPRAGDLADDAGLDAEVAERRDEGLGDLGVRIGRAACGGRRAVQQRAVGQPVLAVRLGLEAVLERELLRLLVGRELELLRALERLGLADDVREGGGRVDRRLLRGERGQPGQDGRRLARARGWLCARGRAANDVVRPAQDGPDGGAGEQQDAGDGGGDAEQDAAGRADEAADERIEIWRRSAPRSGRGRGRGRA